MVKREKPTKDKIAELERLYKDEPKYSIDYFGVYPADIESPHFQKLKQEYGSIVLELFIYLQGKMIEYGKYYISDIDLDKHLICFAAINDKDIFVIKDIYRKLLQYEFLTYIDTDTILGFNITTTSQIIYNYEILHAKKKSDRERQQKCRANKKAEAKEKSKVSEEEAPSAPSFPINNEFGEFEEDNEEYF
ncbi:MAG: hypothetical protein Q4E24_16300 [bacterium]|nr:hypothetical protein [bacterium]